MTSTAIIRVNTAGTVVFTVSALIAAVIFDGFAKTQGVVVAIGLFVSGVVFFLWGYAQAVRRSRYDSMAVTELYFLVGSGIDRRVARTMNGLLVVQVLVAVITASVRASTPALQGRSTPGSTLAFGILVPVFGLGLNGLWASRFGRFPQRERVEKDRS